MIIFGQQLSELVFTLISTIFELFSFVLIERNDAIMLLHSESERVEKLLVINHQPNWFKSQINSNWMMED